MQAHSPMPVAAIVHAGKGQADDVLTAFVDQLKGRGRSVLGLVPGPQAEPGNCSTRTLRDLDTGRIYPISQDLGKASDACSLDAGALLAAAVVLRDARQRRPDLVVVNRFGSLEAEGGGFAQDMLDLMTEGLPVLTVVSDAYLEAWRTFTGGLATELPPDPVRLQQWADSVQVGSSAAVGRASA